MATSISIKLTIKGTKYFGKENVGRILPLFEPQFQCQNSDNAYEQAQQENHPSIQHNEKLLVDSHERLKSIH